MKLHIAIFNISLAIFPFALSAQKLPNKQAVSLRAPADIKVDGKTTEWNNKFQAYNNATELFYTVSNDDENIYFTIMCKQYLIADKIIRGGISITLNSASRKKEDGAVVLTFPVEDNGNMKEVSDLLYTKRWKESDGDKKINKSTDDINALMQKKFRLIEVSGIPSIVDKAVLFNSKEGITATAQFDPSIAYIYELAVPLKYINLNNSDKISYHVKLNGPKDMVKVQPIMPTPINGNELPPPPPPNHAFISATDFWAEYILAQK